MDPDDVMTVSDLCVYLKIHLSTVYRMVTRGQLPHFRIGDNIRFRKQEIDQWMEQRRIKSGPPRRV
jgi:excisionase family DNA binding protein